MDLQCFRESEAKQKSGVPIYIGDSTFICRRYGTDESKKIIKDITKLLYGPFHKVAETDGHEIFAHWLVEYGIVGWENVTDGSQLIEFSNENARKIFLNPEMYLSLNTILFTDVNNFENYLYDETQEDIDNIKKQ